MPHSRKRQLYVEAEPTTDSSSPPIAKRRKLEEQQRHRTPSWFWDNLSRQWLTPRTLREFDRRTEWPAASLPPIRTGKEDIDLAQLKRFARHGGPSLGHLRAVSSIQPFRNCLLTVCQYSEFETAVPSNRTMSSSQSGSRKRAKTGRESDLSSKTKKSSAYDGSFEQHLIDHGVYPHGYDYDDDDGSVYPDNWEEINERLAQPRRSLSPSRFPREAFRKFEKTNMQALTENTVMSKAFPIIAGTSDIPSQENLLFGNLKHLTDGSITKAKPDCYDGSRPADLNKQIREELGSYIVPSINTAAPCLPNFFTEGKGPKGTTDVCKLQALYDGALGARGIHELRSYIGQEMLFDNNTYTITSTYHHSGLLTMYTIHPTASESPINSIEYRMTQLRSFAMTDATDTFRQGASALRNARDWAKEKRDELITAANGKALAPGQSSLVSSTDSFVSLSSNEVTHPESETSTDELALDVGTFTSSSHRTPVRAQTNLPPKVSPNRQSMKASQVKKRPSRRPEASQVIYREPRL